MANILDGRANFEFDGHNYDLVLDNEVMLDAEDILGRSWLDAIEEYQRETAMGQKPRLKTICAIVYGGLKRNHPEITQKNVIDMICSEDPQVMMAINQAMRGAQSPDLAPPRSPEGNAPKAAKSAKPGAKSRAGTGK